MPSLELHFTRRAQRDLRSIAAYTVRSWGEEQRRLIIAQLNRVFAELVDFPEMGEARDDLGAGLRLFFSDPFKIVYRPTASKLIIVRIKNPRQNLTMKTLYKD